MLGTEIELDTIYNAKRKVKVAPGTEAGEKIRLPGEGFYRMGSHDKGSHFVSIKIDIPKRLSRKEQHLFEELRALRDTPDRPPAALEPEKTTG